jgi:hypothetical protein
MEKSSELAKKAILLFQRYLKLRGYTVLVHFELEGCYQPPASDPHFKFDYLHANHLLRKLEIDGELVPEFWSHQWEYVSQQNGQSPLKEAENLMSAIVRLPQILALQGIEQTFIKPVVWSGDQGKMAISGGNIFTTDNRMVHIPNAIQINVSVENDSGENIIVDQGFGEYLQQCFLQTSLACCLLYLPESEAFERFLLKSHYGLADELCSPSDISGGHQGSVALYKEVGKHNQAMGETPLLYDQYHKVMVSEQDWHKTARIEHRLGASSVHYNAYVNVAYALANVIDAVDVYQRQACKEQLKPEKQSIPLATALTDVKNMDGSVAAIGAINLFKNDLWFSRCINKVEKSLQESESQSSNASCLEENLTKVNNSKIDAAQISNLGDRLKLAILEKYTNHQIIMPNVSPNSASHTVS